MPFKDPERRRKYGAEWRQQNREYVLTYRAEYTKENRDKINATWRAWARANEDKRRPAHAAAERRRIQEGKRRLLDAFHWKCVYCGRDLDEQTVTRDHVMPVSAGGSNGKENIVAACFQCNRDKGDRTPEEWQPDKDFGGVLANGKLIESFGSIADEP